MKSGAGWPKRRPVTGDSLPQGAWRSTFVIDREGVLRWGQAGDRQMVRDGAEVLRVLDVIDRLRA